MSLKEDIVSALAGAGLSPLHRFGQNFMIDAAALQTLVAELALSADVAVVEVGPGTGVLTERLLALGARVTAVEIDRGLHDLIAGRFAERIPGQLTLVHGDGLQSKNLLHPAIIAAAATGPWRLGANLPYDVALPVLLNAAALPRPPELAVVTVQWEAAERLCARPGQDAWGASAATLQAAGRPKLLRKLPPNCFSRILASRGPGGFSARWPQAHSQREHSAFGSNAPGLPTLAGTAAMMTLAIGCASGILGRCVLQGAY